MSIGFRTSNDGRWLWPGFGENSRVLKWMCQRVEGKVEAQQTPIGNMPNEGDLDLSGLNIPAADFAELMAVDTQGAEEGTCGRGGLSVQIRRQGSLASGSPTGIAQKTTGLIGR